MQTKALVVIDIQNDITKHYRDIVSNINAAIDWAVSEGMHVVYIKHNNITAATRTFKPGTRGEELAPELKVVSDNIFVKTKSNALTSEAFATFIAENGITEFYVTGADATGCVKSTCELCKKGYVTTPLLCECSRQSVIYSLHSLWKDKNFTVTLCHSILGGGTDCEMRIEVDR